MHAYSPKVSLDYMAPPSPCHPGYGKFDSSEYFQTYRNEVISRINMPIYGGISKHPYTPIPNNLSNKYLNLPEAQFTLIDRGRHAEVDDFYVASQLHRDHYKDHTGSLHPMKYFKSSEYQYQCPTDPTRQYVKCPKYYVKYRQPVVLPITHERDITMSLLPERALTGVYNRSSDVSYMK